MTYSMTGNQRREALAEIQKRFNEGRPFSPSPNSKVFLDHWIMSTYNLNRREAERQIQEWVNPKEGVPLIEVVKCRNKNRKLFRAYTGRKPTKKCPVCNEETRTVSYSPCCSAQCAREKWG